MVVYQESDDTLTLMLRARLIMNPEARGVGRAVARVVAAALESKFKLDSLETEARGAAIDAARVASEEGCEVVIAFGGDGLVNEVANGVAGTDTALAVIPGGTMNVFARNLGMPRDAVEAADRIIRAGERSRIRTVSLASVNDRLFTFACGCGFDAEAATRLEERKFSKRRFGEPYLYATALATFLASYRKREPFLECSGEFETDEGIGVMALNGGTYAYLAGRPVRPVLPGGVEGRLEVLMIRRLSLIQIPRYGLAALLGLEFGKDFNALPGVDRVAVTSGEPFFVHVDGEPLPPVRSAQIQASAATMRVLV